MSGRGRDVLVARPPRPPGPSARPRTARRGADARQLLSASPCAPPTCNSWTSCIGASTSVEPAAEVERAGVRGHACRAPPSTPARAARLLEERRLEVDAGDAVAAAREAKRHPAGAATEVEHVARRFAGQLVPQRQVGGVVAALDVVPDQPRSFPERRRVAAVGKHVTQLEQRRVGGEGVERAPLACFPPSARSKPRSSAGITSSRRWPTPAYFSRSASSSARVPEQTTRAGVRRERLEVRVPDPGDVAAVGDAVVQDHPHVELALAVRGRERAEHLVRAGGVLHEQDRQPRGRRRSICSARPNAAAKASRPAPHLVRASIPSLQAAGGGRGRVVDVVEAGKSQPDARLAARGSVSVKREPRHAAQLARRAPPPWARAARCRSSGTRTRRGGRGMRPSSGTRCRNGGSAWRPRRARSRSSA